MKIETTYLREREKDSTEVKGGIRVHLIGLEPTRLTPLDPKSSAATNYATGAISLRCKVMDIFDSDKVIC